MASPFTILRPDDGPPPDAFHAPWVILMSHWPEDVQQQRLLELIDEQFSNDSRQDFPEIIVIDDSDTIDSGAEHFLTALVDAGAYVMQPEPDVDLERVRNDLEGYANHLLMTLNQDMVADNSSGDGPQSPDSIQFCGTSQEHHSGSLSYPPPPANPEGFFEFAKAVTRLSDDELKQMIDLNH